MQTMNTTIRSSEGMTIALTTPFGKLKTRLGEAKYMATLLELQSPKKDCDELKGIITCILAVKAAKAGLSSSPAKDGK